jgi:hypothetical protein
MGIHESSLDILKLSMLLGMTGSATSSWWASTSANNYLQSPDPTLSKTSRVILIPPKPWGHSKRVGIIHTGDDRKGSL